MTTEQEFNSGMISKQTSTVAVSVVPQTKEAQIQAERMHEVLLLVENLLEREEVTTKIILGCLYDVGSIHWINRRFHFRPVNLLMRWIARLSKPIFKMIALRWVKRNAPRLATNWLFSQVQFKPKPVAPRMETVKVQARQVEDYDREIQQLHSRIRVLTTLLLGTIVSLGGAVAWALWQIETRPSQSIQAVCEAVRSSDPLNGITLSNSQHNATLIQACK